MSVIVVYGQNDFILYVAIYCFLGSYINNLLKIMNLSDWHSTTISTRDFELNSNQIVSHLTQKAFKTAIMCGAATFESCDFAASLSQPLISFHFIVVSLE